MQILSTTYCQNLGYAIVKGRLVYTYLCQLTGADEVSVGSHESLSLLFVMMGHGHDLTLC
jgi:hypothetical protein